MPRAVSARRLQANGGVLALIASFWNCWFMALMPSIVAWLAALMASDAASLVDAPVFGGHCRGST